MAYEPDPDTTSTQLVYDLGGGTFDVSVVRFGPSGAEVLATAGDDQLGGKDWDDVLVDLVADQIESQTGVDPRDDLSASNDLLERARAAKHALSSVQRTAVTLHVAGALHRAEITRAQFESATAPLFVKTEALVSRVLNDIGGVGQLDAVLLVGGSSRMPQCRLSLLKATGLEPRAGVDPDGAVAIGAARIAASHESTAAPLTGARKWVAPMRSVRDVTAHALGFVVVSADGSRYVNQVMIRRNAPIPAAQTKRHELAVGRDDAGVLDVFMLQGEAERPLETCALGRWTFEGVPGNRKGRAEVDVAYEYDADGVVHVSASVGGKPLGSPRIDRADRDLRWTEDDPAAHQVPDLAVALVIDVSGSMSGGKLEEAKRACIGFVDTLEEAGVDQRTVLVPFGSGASVAAPLGASGDRLRDATRKLNVSGSTDMASGLRVAWDALKSQTGRKVLVVLTDGSPDSKPAALAQRDAILSGDGEIIARGVQGADEAFLAQLDSGSELLGEGELVSSFRGIAKQLAGSGAPGRGR
jgi:molecular chaperone DnaK (HSP70)